MPVLSRVIYKGSLRTEAEHLKSGEKVITDAPPDNKGRGEAFSPTDLVSTALAQCMMTLMGIAAQTHEITLGNIEAEVTKIMASDPRRIAVVEIDMRIQNMGYTERQKTILERAAITCPVAKSLSPEVVQEVRFTYY